mmetsp:Transcript_535/g.1258  ORF Transcript_535/g.1258 Transcript_535/m.1258 type:complete len:113 (-) Transcript_535:40-378(-)
MPARAIDDGRKKSNGAVARRTVSVPAATHPVPNLQMQTINRRYAQQPYRRPPAPEAVRCPPHQVSLADVVESKLKYGCPAPSAPNQRAMTTSVEPTRYHLFEFIMASLVSLL